MEDGYKISRMDRFKACSEHQSKIHSRIKEISQEINKLPKIPPSLDKWIEGWSDIDIRGFGMDTYEKHMNFRKEYSQLTENLDNNLREMKILTIEELLEKINKVMGGKNDKNAATEQ